jgi:hypothetical protein
MANILSRIWSALTACFKRQLDDEIVRVITEHEQHHAVHHSTSAPIIIHNWNESPRLKKRRYGVSDLTQIEGYEEFRKSLRL